MKVIDTYYMAGNKATCGREADREEGAKGRDNVREGKKYVMQGSFQLEDAL